MTPEKSIGSRARPARPGQARWMVGCVCTIHPTESSVVVVGDGATWKINAIGDARGGRRRPGSSFSSAYPPAVFSSGTKPVRDSDTRTRRLMWAGRRRRKESPRMSQQRREANRTAGRPLALRKFQTKDNTRKPEADAKRGRVKTGGKSSSLYRFRRFSPFWHFLRRSQS